MKLLIVFGKQENRETRKNVPVLNDPKRMDCGEISDVNYRGNTDGSGD
jgi:hypothetical protein